MSALALAMTALAIMSFSGVLWFAWMRRVQIPEDRTGFVLGWVAGLLFAIAALSRGAEGFALVAAILAILASALLLTTVSISRQKVAPGAIAVGRPIPDFSALDEHGREFQSSSLRGHPTLIKFFRGHW
jgi:hypothetical protein